MRSLLDTEAFEEIQIRLSKIDENTKRKWGKMSAAQMFCHCQAPLNIMLGKDDYGLKPNWFAKVLFKKSLYSDKLWSKGLPTAKAMKQTVERDFNTEKSKLDSLLTEFGTQLNKKDWGAHPGFGYFTDEQWGKMQYKHLDHHLRQFGV